MDWLLTDSEPAIFSLLFLSQGLADPATTETRELKPTLESFPFPEPSQTIKQGGWTITQQKRSSEQIRRSKRGGAAGSLGTARVKKTRVPLCIEASV